MSSKLPPPEQWALCKMNEMEVAEMIEKHIDYYTVNKDGNERSVHLPMPFVRHFMRRSDGKLPTVAAFSTLPLVLADGGLLAPPGLDRKRGIQFLIQDEVRAIVPKPDDCNDAAVKAAMQFLCDEWLIDVLADHDSKSVLIAMALTMIERSLLSERPCFFITAGKRGGGKTTAIKMTIKAVTGFDPVASAWSSNEEERRKALMSHFIHGAPYILWDNVPRGLQISCPHIERSCTSAQYSDRRLGVSEIAQAASSTIHILTGNGLGAKGDLASRSLFVNINVERADPENRDIKHPFPLQWTDDNRGKILASLYTILLGNPQLKEPANAKGKTRFRMWWRLVGSALEHASKLVDETLDFQALFRERDEDDEEADALAAVLEILLRLHPKGFGSKDVAALVNVEHFNHDEGARTIREFLLPGVPDGHVFSAVAIGNRLKKHRDEPVFSGNFRTLTLKSRRDTHNEVLVYKVEASKNPAMSGEPKPSP